MEGSMMVAAALHALAAVLRKRHPAGQTEARTAPVQAALRRALDDAGEAAPIGAALELLVPFMRGAKGPAAARLALQALADILETESPVRAREVLQSPQLLAALTACLRSSNPDTAVEATLALSRILYYEECAGEYLPSDPDAVELLAERMLGGSPREGLQAAGCSVSSPHTSMALVQEASCAVVNISARLVIGAAPRLEDAAIALLWASPGAAANGTTLLARWLIVERGRTRGGRRLAERGALAAGLAELFKRVAAALSDCNGDWADAAMRGFGLAGAAVQVLLATYGDGEVRQLAALLKALSSAVLAPRVLRAEHVLRAMRSTEVAEGIESALQKVSDAAERALECQWLQRREQQQQEGQQQQGRQQQRQQQQPTAAAVQAEDELVCIGRSQACAVCSKTCADGATLRGCRGCSHLTGVRYCSQACCEAHWAKRRHRRLCEMAQSCSDLLRLIHRMRSIQVEGEKTG
ncbi:hypothetical protein Rsub_12931 [Raphidocelis subcapitata]|uniref:MYND-type domain-containing protein n=1 Tax=Raphidocelis subcapitata TaxID=307507 RepID=A0A2V0PPR7_9CHLO|nr:hypothetical protein Rsub_12931 [Raphidocelis subcapitata]|eukprot:GBG00174.1 hypothetical protein Rsub_12931 [Raphidocelis subcapitata]